MTTTAIRAATPGDATAVKAIATESGLFGLGELEGFGEVLSGYLSGALSDHHWIVIEAGPGAMIGAAYYAPEPFSDRVWNLHFIAVLPRAQGGGFGGALIAHVEESLRRLGASAARVLIVETSGLARFEPTRRFYLEHGYVEEARIREFYGPEDDKVVFWKRLDPAPI